MLINKKVKYVGVNDRVTDLFEGQYKIPEGISYNSYVICDEKNAVVDTVDRRFVGEWLENLEGALGGASPDYLIVQHMEPDHSAGIAALIEKYPGVKVVASAKAFGMVKSFFGLDLGENKVEVSDGSRLSLGEYELSFVGAPMVHWPEVVMTYEPSSGILFSADAFGKFGDLDARDNWCDEARRYYIGIVGKYGAQVRNVLKKAAALDIKTICPLHGPVLTGDLGLYLDLYGKWASYTPECEGVVIAYASIYGNTAEAAKLLYDELRSRGVEVEIYDLARSDMHAAVAAAFKFSKLVLASATYNADVFPYMREYIEHLVERNYSGRVVGLIENGSWAPMAAKAMIKRLEGAKNLTVLENTVRITSALDGASRAAVAAMADSLS